jgi:hypothetical protein
LAGRCKEHWVGCPCCQRSEKLFQDTPDDRKLCFVKEEVFGITNGGQSPMEDHPVFMEMFAIPITGALCYSLNFCGLLLLNPPIAGLGWQVISNQRFRLRRRNLKPDASKPAKALRSSRYALPSTVASFSPFHSTQLGVPTAVWAAVPPVIKCIQCFSFIPVWSTSSGMGRVPHSHNTVILL